MKARTGDRFHNARHFASAPETGPNTESRWPILPLAVLGLWGALNVPFVASYHMVVAGASGPFAVCVGSVGIAWILLVSFFASYHITSALLSMLVRFAGFTRPRCYSSRPPVAILCTCMNDLQERTLRSCLAQDYPHFSIFVLDDSTTTAEQRRVSQLVARLSADIHILRRSDRSGFKAGNLNHALRRLDRRYKYFAVVDADEVLPRHFLGETVAVLEASPDLGFVQAAHYPYGTTPFGRFCSDGGVFHWDYFLPARNTLGFVYYYGHGALLRSEAVRLAGGFPEVVSEDLALAVRMRMAGYRGFFVDGIRCGEEAPRDYASYRRRNRKVVSGTIEFMIKFYGRFLMSPRVSWVEKLDLLVASSVIYLPVVLVGFVALFHCLLPVAIGCSWNPLVSLPSGVRETTAIFRPLATRAFASLVLVTVLAPTAYLVPAAVRRPGRTLLHVLRSCTLHLSMSLDTTMETAQALTRRRFAFVATADRLAPDSSALPRWVESVTGIALLLLGLVWASLPLSAIALSILLSTLMRRRNLAGRAGRFMLACPLVLALIGIVYSPALAIGAAGVLAGSLWAQP